MQQLRTRATPKAYNPGLLPALRFEPVIHLINGDIVNLIAETPKRYEERASFGTTGLIAERISPALWLAHQVEAAARLAHEEVATARPIIVAAPIAAMMHPDTPMACDAAAARSHICPQEICIEVEDASLAQSRTDISNSIKALRSKGFRVGINATKSWCTPMDTGLRLMLDSARIDAKELWTSDDLAGRVEAAVACGMAIIAENVNYRDGEDLAEFGIELGLRPRTDA
ncbi:EAL domain-containing protein [Henriciella sp. AS95]|uniref:EAL domain-containing protein n=1 Tax=Henriciella sp. AS95 TaxID=3135782 RepID=UPI00317B5021